MPLVEEPGMRPVRMGDLAADLEARADGTMLVRPRATLGDYPRSMTDHLVRWARERADTVFLADRGPDGEWRRITYAQALAKARSLAQFLIDHGLSAERPLMVLSGNSMEHGLLALAAMMAGIPIAPVSPAYSLVSADHQKLRYLVGLLTPGMIFVADGQPYEKALRAILAPDMTLLTARDPVDIEIAAVTHSQGAGANTVDGEFQAILRQLRRLNRHRVAVHRNAGKPPALEPHHRLAPHFAADKRDRAERNAARPKPASAIGQGEHSGGNREIDRLRNRRGEDIGLLGDPAVDQSGRHLASAKCVRIEQVDQESAVVGDAKQRIGHDCGAQPRDRLGAVATMCDHLGDHRIVIRRHRSAFRDAIVDPHALSR